MRCRTIWSPKIRTRVSFVSHKQALHCQKHLQWAPHNVLPKRVKLASCEVQKCASELVLCWTWTSIAQWTKHNALHIVKSIYNQWHTICCPTKWNMQNVMSKNELVLWNNVQLAQCDVQKCASELVLWKNVPLAQCDVQKCAGQASKQAKDCHTEGASHVYPLTLVAPSKFSLHSYFSALKIVLWNNVQLAQCDVQKCAGKNKQASKGLPHRGCHLPCLPSHSSSSFKVFTSLILFCFENVCKIYCIMRVLSWQCYTIHLVFLSLFFLKLLGNLYKRYKSNVYLALRPGDCWQPQEY